MSTCSDIKSTTSTLYANSFSSCYNTATGTKFLSFLSSLLNSVSNLNFYSLEIVDEWQLALENIADCLIQDQICGQSPFEYGPDGSFSHSFGLQNSALSRSFCGGAFSVDSFGSTAISQSDLQCIRFQCLRYPQTGLINTDKLISQDENNVDVSLLSSLDFVSSDGNLVDLKNSDIKGSISFDSSFVAKYGLEGYNPLSTENNAHLMIPAILEYPADTPSLAYYSTEGIFLSVNPVDGVASFTSNKTGSFVLIGTPILILTFKYKRTLAN
jgi:hypothetical protein